MTRSSQRAVVCFSVAIALTVVAMVAWTHWQFEHRAELSRFVGSPGCVHCHIDEAAQWRDSLHARMMRRVDQPGVLVADLSPDHPDLSFDPSLAVWAIGSKWEQQFMGEERGETGVRETLLPGAWEVSKSAWKTTGWDGWQVPDPLVRCHGCHTVGFEPKTGHFAEPGIGCESCHGQGGWHEALSGFGAIAASLDAQVCGQCHSRGRSVDGAYFFPVGYRPGGALADHFNESTPDMLQNSSAWWGSGSERKRHQQYTAWKTGGHADSLRSLTDGYDGRYGQVGPKCLGCHAGEAALDRGRRYDLDEVQHGIACAVCHRVHGDLHQPRLTCADCHGEGAFHHQPERNAEHVPCPEDSGVGCVDCHMPKTGKNGGAYLVHSHRPGIVQPQETATFGVPSSCANGGCHNGMTPEALQTLFEASYPSATKPERLARDG